MAAGYSVTVLVYGLGLAPTMSEAEKAVLPVLMAFQVGIPLLMVGISAIVARFRAR